MRAANPLDAAESSADKRSYEPSMEEILASIRRIIADDQSLPSRPSATLGAASVPPDAPAGDVSSYDRPSYDQPEHDLQSTSGASPDWEHTPPIAIAPEPDPEPEPDRAPEPELEPEPVLPPSPSAFLREAPFAFRPSPDAVLDPAPVPAPEPVEAKDKASIFSAETDAAVGAAFNMLAASRLASSSDEIMALAREMIRPLLRTWIDDNLPSMVERLVKAEIERVARGGR